jgi:hypothetical protein
MRDSFDKGASSHPIAVAVFFNEIDNTFPFWGRSRTGDAQTLCCVAWHFSNPTH